MEAIDVAKEALDTMLGYLGFVVTIEVETDRPDLALQVITEESKLLIGRHGERLEEIQLLVNRLVQAKIPNAPRVRVDIDHYRALQEDRLIEDAEHLGERVLNSGKPAELEPLNSYHRRVIHHHFEDHPTIKTWSPRDSARLKRITLSPR